MTSSIREYIKRLVDKFFQIYVYDYKKVMLYTVIFLLISSIPALYFKLTRGYILEKDYSIKGGSLIAVKVNRTYDINKLKEELSKEFKDFSIRELRDRISGKVYSYEIIVGEKLEKERAKEIVEKLFGDVEFSLLYQSPSLGEEFFKQAIIIILVSILFMGLVVYYYFRNIASMLSIMISTISDIIFTIFFMPVVGVKLSIASFGAILMILGYSVDSDVLLSTLIVKRRDEHIEKRVKRMVELQVLLDVVAFAAYIVMILFSNVDIIKNIGMVLMLGLIFDLITTLGIGYPLQRILVMKE